MGTQATSINLNRLHFPVSTLGFGQRVALWVQGCSLQCPGCISHDTWEPNRGQVPFSQLTATIEPWLEQSDGLTISGGEPFEQPEALARLLAWWRQRHRGDILVFSGMSWERLCKHHSDVLAQIDVVVSDPFLASAGHDLPLRGSDNQRLHRLTPLAEEHYAVIADQRVLDLCWDGNRVWMAGIPHPADLAALHERLRSQGLDFLSSEQDIHFAEAILPVSLEVMP